jgi:hypothetical protein
MSHLSILPTVLRDVDVLIQALEDLDLTVIRGGDLSGFADQREAVALRVQLPEGTWLGWRHEPNGEPVPCNSSSAPSRAATQRTRPCAMWPVICLAPRFTSLKV